MFEIYIDNGDAPVSTDPNDWISMIQSGSFNGVHFACAEIWKDGERAAIWDRGSLVSYFSLDDNPKPVDVPPLVDTPQ